MTVVTIKMTEKPQQEVTHKVGNFYKRNNDLYLLCYVEERVALVHVKEGWYYNSSHKLSGIETMQTIKQSTFETLADGEEFVIVDKITISEE